MLTQLKNRFSRSPMIMSTSVPKTVSKPKPKPKVRVAVSAVKSVKVPTKVLAKVSVAKKMSRVTAEGEQCFWTNDGTILATHTDLKRALKDMKSSVYKYHTDGRNDFASWVEAVLQDSDCANELRKAKTQKAALAAVSKALA